MVIGGTGLALMYLLSTGAGAMLLVSPLESQTPALASPIKTDAQAIVLLTGGGMANAPEYGGQDIPNTVELARIRYAAKLHRETKLPILISGGLSRGLKEPGAILMDLVLREDFGISAKWLEGASINTAESAQATFKILEANRVRKILLVTDAIHMTRARSIFSRQNLEVIGAPTLFMSTNGRAQTSFLPDGGSIWLSRYALHEWIGILWYRIRYL
jgi:uncharacterized SAM-binding protein YcdF (DUF218 family)